MTAFIPKYHITYSRLIVAVCLFSIVVFYPLPSRNQTSKTVLSDPVAFGAWLYEGNCKRCHSTYDEARVAENYEDLDELKAAIEKDECRVAWAVRYGGTLRNKEIVALVEYMTRWEELGQSPPLPELPPQPQDETLPFEEKKPEPEQAELATTAQQKADPKLKLIFESNPLAKGGWLYTQHCYRCHLHYEQTRTGQGINKETVKKTIRDGKTSTQMTPFSQLKGGELSGSEIDAIVDYIVTWERFGEPLALPELVLTVPGEDPSALKPIGLPRFNRIRGDPKGGQVEYVRNCSACHGINGEGYIGKPLNKTWWIDRLDLFARSVIKNGVPGSIMKSWSEGAGGELTAIQIDNLVALIDLWATKKEDRQPAQ